MQILCNVGLAGPNNRQFLTFTHPEALEYDDYRREWNRLLKCLRRYFPGFAGVRVHEQFPGAWGWQSHGLHTHVICDAVASRKQIKAICRMLGWGRLGFEVVKDASRSVAYISKYLCKERPASLKGWQLSRSFGIKDACRRIDIVKESAMKEAWAWGAKSAYFEKLTFREKCKRASEILFAMVCGRIECESLSNFPFDFQDCPF